MPNYKYRATAMSGKTVRGNLVASDPEALLNELKKQDLFLLDYTQTNKTSFGSKLKPKELTDFCRQLGSLLDAGVSVIQSFNIISNRASISKFARKSFSDITTDLKHGKALSEAMADQGKVFPELLISMVRAGEASGKIGDTFLSMGQHFQKQQRIKSQVKGALAYPIVLMILLVLVIIVMFTFILPMFGDMFTDMELPLMTRVLMGIRQFPHPLLVCCRGRGGCAGGAVYLPHADAGNTARHRPDGSASPEDRKPGAHRLYGKLFPDAGVAVYQRSVHSECAPDLTGHGEQQLSPLPV